MRIWVVSREYAGIAEAGGVKNVSCSLSESLVKLGHEVIVFMPCYACTDFSRLETCTEDSDGGLDVNSDGRTFKICCRNGTLGGVKFVFFENAIFGEKQAVYTYTKSEEKINPCHCHGMGHADSPLINSVFQKSVVAYWKKSGSAPDIIHCQDATAALVPTFMEDLCKRSPDAADFYRNTKCVVTIHNAGPGYHHDFASLDDAARFTGLPEDVLCSGLSATGRTVEPFLLASSTSCITTVSPEYAREIELGTTDTAGLSEGFRKRGVKILGITNGIDVSRYSPQDKTCSLLPFEYNPEKKDFEGKLLCRKDFLEKYAGPECASSSIFDDIEQYGHLDREKGEEIYIAYHGRVVSQKGISVLAKAADILLGEKLPVRFIFIGQGQSDLEKELMQLSLKHEGKSIYFRGYDRSLSRMCIAVSDFAVFPSFFEPCGLEDMIAQIFGTIPVAHATGGLCKIIDDETGFLYKNNTPEELAATLYSLVKIKYCAGGNIFNNMISFAASYVRKNFSWLHVAENSYIPLYESLIGSGGKKQK
ncbi:MAG: glycogen/starch synthase [Treponema sp.]|nr:glycogen/starch synthase [Treponema sp.]